MQAAIKLAISAQRNGRAGRTRWVYDSEKRRIWVVRLPYREAGNHAPPTVPSVLTI
jgi:hypothetical protein